MFSRFVVTLLGITALTIPVSAQRPAPQFDLLVRGGTVIDGTGAPAFRADIGITGDRITRIKRSGLAAESARSVIDATGLMIAPGFIDSHAHVATAIVEYRLAENFIRQGITSIIASLHSRAQPWPLAAYADSLRAAPNVGFFAGHRWVCTRVIGLDARAPRCHA
ncbi:MAG: amidohydrolase family protein [Gemmatimonadaceae bacterium]